MKRKAQIIAMGLAAALGLAVSIPAQAATWTVTNLADSGAGTLRGCIGSAAPSGDTIQFDTNGTISLSSSLNITSDVSIVGLGPTNITISGGATCRILTATNVSAAISGLTIQ